jgi:uncharacterized protein (TIGR02271 family)
MSADRANRKELALHEEELELDTLGRELGAVRARRRIESDEAREIVPRTFEHAHIEHEPAREGDSGEIETLPDGSISIPLLEEELVITTRVVVRERIVIRKKTETEAREVRAQLRRERLDIETTEDTSKRGGSDQ